MNLKLMLLLLVFLTGVHYSSSAEPADNGVFTNAIMDSDEVRIFYLVRKNEETRTGYQTTTQKGKEVLADVFAKVELVRQGSTNGSGDPTGGAGFATTSGMRINLYKNKKMTHEIVVIGFEYVNLRKPENVWFEASFQDASKEDNTVSGDKSLIELRILNDVKKSTADGDWKEAPAVTMAEFMPENLDGPSKK